MKTIILLLFFCCTVSPMQQYKCRVERRNSAPARIICEPVNEIRLNIPEQARTASDIRERRRYKHKMKIAMVSLATSVVGGITTLIIYLTK